MSEQAPAKYGRVFSAIILPTVGSTQVLGAAPAALVTGGNVSAPMQAGLYRFHAVADANVGLVDNTLPVANTASASDMLLQAGVDEYFYVPSGGVISWFGGDVSVTLAP